jgi:hypothetical protein
MTIQWLFILVFLVRDLLYAVRAPPGITLSPLGASKVFSLSVPKSELHSFWLAKGLRGSTPCAPLSSYYLEVAFYSFRGSLTLFQLFLQDKIALSDVRNH